MVRGFFVGWYGRNQNEIDLGEDKMDLLIVMGKVGLAISIFACLFLGVVFMLAAIFLTAERLKRTGTRGVKIRHRIPVFVLGYLLLCLGVYLIGLLS